MTVSFAKARILVLGIGFVAALGLPAYATPITGGPGISAPNTVNFGELLLSGGAPVTTQFGEFGVTFGNAFYTPEALPDVPNVNQGHNVGNFQSETLMAINPLEIFFNTTQTSADVSTITNTGTSLFEALLNGNIVDSFNAPTDLNIANNFYGFTGESFDEIAIFAGGNNNSMEIGIIQFNAAPAVPEPAAAVPEPASLALFGAGLLGLGLFRRRKRA